MWNLPPGRMSAMCGTRAAIRLKSSRCELDARLVGDGEQVEDGVRRAAERRRQRDRVLERRLGHDHPRRDPELEHPHDGLAGGRGVGVTAGVDGGR